MAHLIKGYVGHARFTYSDGNFVWSSGSIISTSLMDGESLYNVRWADGHEGNVRRHDFEGPVTLLTYHCSII
jgi:hypothetical protein